MHWLWEVWEWENEKRIGGGVTVTPQSSAPFLKQESDAESDAIEDVDFWGYRINFGGRGQYLKWGGYKGSWGPHPRCTPS